MVSVACLVKLVEVPVGGSGDQYELCGGFCAFAGACCAAFLALEALRGLVMPLFCTRVTGVLWTGALMVGMEPSRADRRRDIIELSIRVNVWLLIELYSVSKGLGGSADEIELRPRISD